jgi:hypothetical protein
MEIDAFLTAYDPSDLPGTSIDPLGFERGYLFLADKILPGLTNVANRPRYFSVLCAGAYIGDKLFNESPRTQYNARLMCMTRLERFWALANVLAASKGGDSEKLTSGLRGVTYAQAKANDVLKNGDRWVNADFKLLSRQIPYGAVGIYGAVADRMRFLNREELVLSPDLGEKLAEGFMKVTSMPKSLVRAVEKDDSIDVNTLCSWGKKAYIGGIVGKTEAHCFRDALHLDPVRSRMAVILSRFSTADKEPELNRLSKIFRSLRGQKDNIDLKEAIHAILSYEKCYKLVLLAFERMLWLCRRDQAGSVSQDSLMGDQVIETVRDNLPGEVNRFLRVLEACRSENFLRDLQRLNDVRFFLKEAETSCRNGGIFIDSIMARHADIQKGKFDKGRRKMPWLEFFSRNRIALTSTRVGGLGKEATRTSDIAPHPYRLDSADALILASGEL